MCESVDTFLFEILAPDWDLQPVQASKDSVGSVICLRDHWNTENWLGSTSIHWFDLRTDWDPQTSIGYMVWGTAEGTTVHVYYMKLLWFRRYLESVHESELPPRCKTQLWTCWALFPFSTSRSYNFIYFFYSNYFWQYSTSNNTCHAPWWLNSTESKGLSKENTRA